MKYEIYKAYGKTYDRTVDSWEAVMEFVVRKANKMNFGMYRTWELEGNTFFDCGPTVYVVKEIAA